MSASPEATSEETGRFETASPPANDVQLPPFPEPERPPRGAKEALGLAARKFFYLNGTEAQPENVFRAIGGTITLQSLRAHRIEAAALRRAAGIVEDVALDRRVAITLESKERFVRLYVDDKLSIRAAAELCGFSDRYGAELLQAREIAIRPRPKRIIVDRVSSPRADATAMPDPTPKTILDEVVTKWSAATCAAFGCDEPVATGRNCCPLHFVTRPVEPIDLTSKATRDKERAALLAKIVAPNRIPTPLPPPEPTLSPALQSEFERERQQDQRLRAKRHAVFLEQRKVDRRFSPRWSKSPAPATATK